MKKLLFIVVLPVLLSSCKQPEPPASVTDPVPTRPEMAAQKTSLPKGLALDVPYTVVSDEWVEEESERKRKVVIEFEQAAAASVGEAIMNGMVAARYRPTGSSEVRGGERLNFRGDPAVRVSILVRPRNAVALQNPAATGSIEFTLREPREASASAQVAD